MRNRSILAIVASFLFLAASLIGLRHHLTVLYETARTYATYHAWVSGHPESLYKVPSDRPLESSSQHAKVAPTILHQIYLSGGNDSIPIQYRSAQESCQALHANWTHHLWTEASAAAFMKQNYPQVHSHYLGYKQNIQRANILRYALLHHFGGVYLDLDVQCLQPLDALLHVPFLTPGAHPAGVNNAFILARPGHSFLQSLLDKVSSRDLAWGFPYVENMLSTGCMFFSNQWMSHVRTITTAAHAAHAFDDFQVYTLADERGDLGPHMLRGVTTTPLFRHGGASSWHGWDAAAILMIGNHYQQLLPGLVFVVSLIFMWLVLVVWRQVTGSPARTRFSSPWTTKSSFERSSNERIEYFYNIEGQELYKQS